MADNFHLVSNERDNYSLIHEGRVYNLKRTNMEDKQCVCRQVKKVCRCSIHTNLDVDAILDCNPHADDCIPDNDIVYKMEKKNALKRRAAEELKTIPQIYHEEASSASADLETAGYVEMYFQELRCVTPVRCCIRDLLHLYYCVGKFLRSVSKLMTCTVKKGCRGSIHTNLDVDAILDCNPHADDCIPDNDILYKMEKKTVLKRRAAEEMKTVPQIYHEEASSASADLETAGEFPTYKSVKTAMYRKRAQKFPRLLATRQ
ncbi:hypothetical protein T03_6561 [Trichinella britovi]|uniref:Uncharacterized protein n=1 Tax=Trichinella britovi TaxID=45882 RepID=A0A0V1CU22_TRIBR|nr:hypothetical protein T03_6561 [Trichinella britovi]